MELALGAVYGGSVKSEERAHPAAQPTRGGRSGRGGGSGWDTPRVKLHPLDGDQQLAYLRRYLRRNIHNLARTAVTLKMIEGAERGVLLPGEPFDIVGVDTERPEFLRVYQKGIPKSAWEEQVRSNPLPCPAWLVWKADKAKRLQQLENWQAKQHPHIIE